MSYVLFWAISARAKIGIISTTLKIATMIKLATGKK